MADQKSDDKREKYREALEFEFDKLGGSRVDFWGAPLLYGREKERWLWLFGELERLKQEDDDARWATIRALAGQQSGAKEPPE